MNAYSVLAPIMVKGKPTSIIVGDAFVADDGTIKVYLNFLPSGASTGALTLKPKVAK